MNRWQTNTVRYSRPISMMRKLYSFFRLISATGDRDSTLPITTRIKGKFGSALSDWMGRA